MHSSISLARDRRSRTFSTVSDFLGLKKAVFGLLTFALASAAAFPVCAALTTIDLTLTGRPARVDLYSPESPARGAVVLAHGFLRSRENMAGHAEALAREGYLAIAPELPYRTSSPDNARALAELVGLVRAGAFAAPIDRVVLVGFSAGGLSTLLAAPSPGVVGYVGLDPIDRPGGPGLEVARTLSAPVVLLHGPRIFCNAYRIAEPWSKAFPNLVEDRLIEEASHCDFEAPTDRWCTFVCGATSTDRQQIVHDALLAAVRRLLPPQSAQPADSNAKVPIQD